MYHQYKKTYSGSYLGQLTPLVRKPLYSLIARSLVYRDSTERILDVGTGPGHLVRAIQKRAPEAFVVGVDRDAGILPDEWFFVHANAESLPFDADSFDQVVTMMSLHQWEDKPKVLKEIRRVLKPEGRLTILVGRKYLLEKGGNPFTFVTRQPHNTLKALLEDSGFVAHKIVRYAALLHATGIKS